MMSGTMRQQFDAESNERKLVKAKLDAWNTLSALLAVATLIALAVAVPAVVLAWRAAF
jgi:hypothetical protein